MAREAPGFAGMFYDDDGRLNILAKPEVLASTKARQTLFSVVNNSLQASGRSVPAQGNVTVIEATRDFLELAALSDRVFPLLAEPGVVFTDIDEARNRLRIGVLDMAAMARISTELQGMQIGEDAVNIELTRAVVPLTTTIREFQDPIGGGLQISFMDQSFIYVCTLGFNVLLGAPERAQPYFFTNSHCTDEMGVVTGTEYWMPLPPFFPGDNRFIGTEAFDPPFFSSPCFVGWRCRWSDAALVRYAEDAPVDLGRIYGTTGVGTGGAFGSVEIDGTQRPLSVVAEAPYPFLGEILDKIGATSGWTRGPVIGTCVNYAIVYPVDALLCQDEVSAGVFFGDSGSPVFQPLGSSRNVKLYGIVWGANFGGLPSFILSAVDNLRYEFSGPECRVTGGDVNVLPVRCPQDRSFRTH